MKPSQPLLLLIAFIIIGLPSCKKEDRPPTDTGTVKQVKQLSYSANDFVSYEYNEKGLVTKHVSQWANGNGGVNKINYVYTYDAANRLIKWSNEAGNSNFIYKNDVLESSENFLSNGKKLSTTSYAFQNKKLVAITERTIDPNPDDIEETRIAVSYRPDGNVGRIDYAYRKDLGEPFTTDFSKVFETYDNHTNPEPDGISGVIIPGVVLYKNNPLRVNTVSANNTQESYLRFEYTYNTTGLPEQRKQYLWTNDGKEHPAIVGTYVY